MNKIKEIKDYLMTFGYNDDQADNQIKQLLDNNELEDFHSNMYI